MKIFLTGATGYIGSAVLDALIRAGHQVTAIVRDNEKAARVADRGAQPILGNLAEPDFWRKRAEGHEAYVHTAFDSSPRGPATDRTAIDVLMAMARREAGKGRGRGRLFLYTSGLWVLGRAPEPIDESAPLNPIQISAWRAPHEQVVRDAASGGLRTAIIRPGIVYGGARGIMGDVFRSAVNGLVRVIGDGNNRWPLIYERDVADLYARVVANEAAEGVYHATDDADERVNDIVEAISPYLNTRPDVRHVPIEEARSKMGVYADALALDQVVRSPRSRELGWAPQLHSVSGNAARLLEEWRRGQEA